MRRACSWGLEQGIVLICSPEKEDESASLQKLLPMNSTAWMDKPKRDPGAAICVWMVRIFKLRFDYVKQK